MRSSWEGREIQNGEQEKSIWKGRENGVEEADRPELGIEGHRLRQPDARCMAGCRCRGRCRCWRAR